MNILKLISACLVLLGTTVTTSAIASEHDHNHASSRQNMHLDQGKKWSIDASLHIGMTQIKISIEENISEIHHKKFTDAQYKSLAGKVDAQLAYLFENCKLPKDADAQLHILLFDIMQASNKMQSSNNPRSGAITIIKALQKYPHYFEDKDWQALKH
ncbi:hypothetical protein [Colwellia psychrerythraea]|uniref:DnrO protein n=1 Tax=Colwellia psychrerythraea TaxID=28229 RepID=A0A099KZD3_COLPS|nr:hypothetical protein [Colwellia psychrerythraea]KGJ95555.1 hypothetical protein ND2E_1337 [Colwellia psychrerythraea]